MGNDTLAEWQELYRLAVSSFYVDPVTGHLVAARSYRLDYESETELLSGTAFLSSDVFDKTVTKWICTNRELYGIEVPTYSEVKVTNFRIARSRCNGWKDFNRFQTKTLFDCDLHVGLAILDRTGDWVLVKDPDIVYLFVRKPDQ